MPSLCVGIGHNFSMRYIALSLAAIVMLPLSARADEEIHLNPVEASGSVAAYDIDDTSNAGEVDGEPQGRIAPQSGALQIGDVTNPNGEERVRKSFLLFHLPPLSGNKLLHATLRLFLGEVRHEATDARLPSVSLLHAKEWPDESWASDTQWHGLQTWHFGDNEIFSEKTVLCESDAAPGSIDIDVTSMIQEDYRRNPIPVAAFRMEISGQQALDIGDKLMNAYIFYGAGEMSPSDRVPTLILAFDALRPGGNDEPPVQATKSDGAPPKYGHDNPEHGVPIQIPERDPKLEWFETAKLGIFLHWGIWSVDCTAVSNCINHPPTPGLLDAKVYYTQLPRWHAENYDPSAWAEIFRKAGAKYTILTTKHHDGVALWDTKAPGGVDVVDQGGVKRDLLAPWVAAMRKEGLKIGFYFSDADWGNPDYASMPPPPNQAAENRNAQTFPLSYSEKEEPERWARFLKYRDIQIKELLQYKPAIWWFDGCWERTSEQWNAPSYVDLLLKNDPNVIFGRMVQKFPGTITYTTPETVMPLTTPTGPWELCLTSSDTWSYVATDKQDKNAELLVKIFSEMIGRGGNLLLNIGPKADGTLPENEVKQLLRMGEWIQRNAEAIYPTFGGEEFGFSFLRFFGPTTVAPDGKALYLFVDGQPNDSMIVRGIVSKIRKAEVLSTGEDLDFRRLPGNGRWPGYYVIKTPKSPDPLMTVIKLSFDDVIELSGN